MVDLDAINSRYAAALNAHEAGRLDEAIAAYRELLSVEPRLPEVYNSLGDALSRREDHEDAVSAFRRAVAFRRDYLDAHFNLGNVLKRLGRLDESLFSYDRCLELSPEHSGAHWNRSLALLLQGDYAEGFREYEWRFAETGNDSWWRREADQMWSGEASPGGALLVVAEQGIGDTVQLARYASVVASMGMRFCLQADESLHRLLAGVDDIHELITQEALAYRPADRYMATAPLFSLPHILGTTLATIPSKQPYLAAEPELVDYWAAAINRRCGQRQKGKRRVGIAWQGSPTFVDDPRRSFHLRHFDVLARFSSVRLVSFQAGFGSEQVGQVGFGGDVIDMGAELDKGNDRFIDTVAALQSMDLLVTSDSAIAHVAAASGVPVWVLLARVPDWRWGLEGEIASWYPGEHVRLYRQVEDGNWDEVFKRVASDLSE